MDERDSPPPTPRADLGPLQALGRVARMFYAPRRAAAAPLLPGGRGDPTGADVTLPSSLAYYLPSEGIAPAPRSLASAVDLFSLWYWGLVVLGLAIVARVPKVRVLVPAAVFWALGVVLKAATLSLARGTS